MPQYIKKIRTGAGDLQIDYEALANLPELGALASKDKIEKTDLASDVQEILDKVENTGTGGGSYVLELTDMEGTLTDEQYAKIAESPESAIVFVVMSGIKMRLHFVTDMTALDAGFVYIAINEISADGQSGSLHCQIYDNKQYEVTMRQASLATKEYVDNAVANAGGDSVTVDTTFTQEGEAADAKATGDRIRALEDALADLTYEPIKITSFTLTPQKQSGSSQVNVSNPIELGTKVNLVKFNWVIDRAAQKIVLTSSASNFGTEDVTSAATSGNYSRSFTAGITKDTSFTLTVTDQKADGTTKNTTSTKTLNFYNGVYYGAAAQPSSINSAFVLGLTKELRSDKKPSFNANAGAGQYIWYCLPKSMGTCAFNMFGFDGGFIEPTIISFTNASGHTEDYYVYRSNQEGLGTLTVKVS